MAEQTLAQRVRKQYPGAYDDLSDADLERMVDERHPGVYDDIPRTAEPMAEPTAEPGPLSAMITGEPQPRSFMEETGRQLALTGRAALAGVGTFGDLMAQGGQSIMRGLPKVVLPYPLGDLLSARISRYTQDLPNTERGLTAARLPVPETGTERVVYDINRGAAAAATSVGAAGLAKPVTEVGKGVAATLAARPGSQIVSAGTGAGASGVTREAGGGPVAQAAAGMAAGVTTGLAFDKLADRLAGITQANWKPQYRQVMQASDEFDVPVSYGDVAKGATAPKIETTLEQVPGIGMAGFREAQHGKAMTAAQQFRDDFGTGSGPEWAAVAAQSMSRRVGRMKDSASSMYDDVQKLSAGKAVPIGRTLSHLDDEIAQAQGALMPSGLAPKLQTLRENVATAYQKDNFERLRQFRSDLGDAIRSTTDRKELRVLTGIKRALEEDMSEFARKEGGELWEKWRAADKFYATEFVPARKLAERFDKIEDPDALYDAFLRAATKTPQTLYKAMGKQAQASVRYGLVHEAFERGLNAEGTRFSPAKFAKYLEDRQRATGVFFEGDDKTRLDGFVALMRHAQRGGQYMENPPTGNRWLVNLLTLGVAPAAYLAPTATAGTATALLGLKSLFTTDTGKRLLMTVSKHPDDAKYIEGALRFYAPALGTLSAQSPAPETAPRTAPPRPAPSSEARAR